MKRIGFEITDEQHEFLRTEGKKRGIPYTTVLKLFLSEKMEAVNEKSMRGSFLDDAINKLRVA